MKFEEGKYYRYKLGTIIHILEEHSVSGVFIAHVIYECKVLLVNVCNDTDGVDYLELTKEYWDSAWNLCLTVVNMMRPIDRMNNIMFDGELVTVLKNDNDFEIEALQNALLKSSDKKMNINNTEIKQLVHDKILGVRGIPTYSVNEQILDDNFVTKIVMSVVNMIYPKPELLNYERLNYTLPFEVDIPSEYISQGYSEMLHNLRNNFEANLCYCLTKETFSSYKSSFYFDTLKVNTTEDIPPQNTYTLLFKAYIQL